jgi:uncharacterized protein (TIGR02099 family)
LYTFACIIILFAVFGVTLKSLTPVINNHKAYIEQYASDLVHADVHIDSIRANWARFGPEIHFTGVSLVEPGSGHTKSIIKADELTIHVGIFRTLWRRSIYFRSLELSGSDVTIDETAPHQYLINNAFSVDLSDQAASQAPEVFAWLITQNHIRLSNTHIGLRQLDESAISIQLDQANVYQSDKGESKKKLSVFIDANVQGEVVGPTHQLRTFKSKITLSTWIGLLKQKPTFVEVELLNRDLVFQDDKKIHRYPSLEGVFLWQSVGEDWLLQGKEVTLTKDADASSDYSFEAWRFPGHYSVHLNSINLSDVVTLAEFLNFTSDKLDLEKMNIQGALEDIDIVVPHDVSAINEYQFSAALRNLSSMAYHAFPEMHHLSGAFSGSVAQGSFVLSDSDDAIYFEPYFNQPIAIKSLTASGQWKFANETLSLWLRSMHALAPEVEAQGAMKLEIPFNQTGSATLAVLGEYDLKQSQAAVSFLPMKEFDSDFAQWLTAAVGKGWGSEGKVLIRGPIESFPYSNKEGVFIVDGAVKPLTVSFSPEWPKAENVSGQLWLHNQTFGMQIEADTQGVAITSAKVIVPDYQADNVIVNVDLQATAEAPEYLQYIHLSPLNSTLGQWLKPFDLTGPGALSLHLELPIAHLDNDHIKVAGQWLAQGAGFAWKDTSLILENIQGAIGFTESSISANKVEATLGQEPVQLSIRTEKAKGVMTAIDVDARGELSVPQLSAISKIDWLSFYLVGRSNYRAHLRIPMTTPEYLVSLDTDMRGMRVKLPGALGKEAKSSAPFSLHLSMNPTTDVAQLVADYTKNLSATINIQHYSQIKSNKQTIQVDARAVAFSWPLVIPLPKNTPSNGPLFWQSLTTFTGHITHLSLYKNDFSNVLISAVRNKDNISWRIKANEAQGNIVLPEDPKKSIVANFDYLTLQAVENAKKSASTTEVERSDSGFSAKIAATWPEFFLHIQQLKIGKRTLGAVKLQTSPVANGIQFKTVDINNSTYHIASQGSWLKEGGKEVTYLDGIFTTKNLGDFLSKNNITQNFHAKAGEVKFNLHWLGSPMQFQLKALEGSAAADVKNGVIPLSGDSAKNGLGKVLTLFSAQSIQRRFQLNFSDLGENGYSFNSFVTILHFKDGNAKVVKGEFDGPEAKIGFTGRLGLVKQDYDLYLVVTPYVTSSLPLIATLAGGPIAGVATYAFDKLAAGSIAKFTSYKYLLRGPWAKPQLISLDLEPVKKPEEKNIAPIEEAKS